MTLPFDTSKPDHVRPARVVFLTDEDTARWLTDQAEETELGVSLICHRIIKQARESTAPRDTERRDGEDRRRTA